MGFTIRYDNGLETQKGNLCANLHFRISNIRKLPKLTNFKTRLTFIKSLGIGKLIYVIPLYTQTINAQINKFHKVIMAAPWASIGSYCFKKSIGYILGKCNLLTAKQLISYSSI